METHIHSACISEARAKAPVYKYHGTALAWLFIFTTLYFSSSVFAGTVMPPATSPPSILDQFGDSELQNVESRIDSLRTGATNLGARFYGERGAVDDLLESSRLSVFVNGDFNTGDRDGSPRESGFDYDSGSVTGGLYYPFSNEFVAGVAIGHNRSDILTVGLKMVTDHLISSGMCFEILCPLCVKRVIRPVCEPAHQSRPPLPARCNRRKGA